MTPSKMHDHEIEIDELLVARLIQEQFPKWQKLAIKHVPSAGTDNAVFRLGADKCIRLPRIPESVYHVEREQKFLPLLSTKSSLSIPTILGEGSPGCGYPYPWSVFSWIEGETAYSSCPHNLDKAATDLAQFIGSLWQIDAKCGPKASRSILLNEKDEETKQAFLSLKGEIDTEVLETIWQKCLHAPHWGNKPVWFHGDLLPTNLIVRDGSLVAVIDFDLMGVGDPAVDLLPAWSLFDAKSRRVFKDALGVDDATWLRGCGWALTVAVSIIPYYRATNPPLTSIARRMVAEILMELISL